MMNTPRLASGLALLSALALLTANAQAVEAGAGTSGAHTAVHNAAEGGADRTKEPQLAADGAQRLKQNQVAEGGADRLRERQLAEGGADRLRERQLASDGSDRLKQNNVAAGGRSHLLPPLSRASSCIRLRHNHYADGSNGYDASSDVMPYFCMECR